MVDIQRELWAHFPPTGVVIVRRDLVKAQFEVVIGADPLGRINRAFFQSLVNLAARDVLGDHTQALEHTTGKSTATELQTLEVGN